MICRPRSAQRSLATRTNETLAARSRARSAYTRHFFPRRDVAVERHTHSSVPRFQSQPSTRCMACSQPGATVNEEASNRVGGRDAAASIDARQADRIAPLEEPPDDSEALTSGEEHRVRHGRTVEEHKSAGSGGHLRARAARLGAHTGCIARGCALASD